MPTVLHADDRGQDAVCCTCFVLLAAIRWDQRNRYDVLFRKLLTLSVFVESESRRPPLLTALSKRLTVAIFLLCLKRTVGRH